MEDKEELLNAYGIEKGRWTDEIGMAKEEEKEEGNPKTNPANEEYDPYLLVAKTIKDLEIEDLGAGLISLNKSLSDSVQRRETLVRNHFSTYVKCRELLEEMSEVQKKIKDTDALEKVKAIIRIEASLAPVHRENKEIEQRKKKVEFFNKNRVLFDGPDILEEHLLLLDFQSFLSSYKQAKVIFEKYKSSKFIVYLWSKFVQVLQRFKSEIAKRIEGSECIAESIHYMNIYIQIDPASATRTFGTFLVIAKKEFYASVERLQMRQKEKPSQRPEKTLLCFVDEQLERFLFMVRSMDAVELIYEQEKHMHDFVSNGIESFANTITKAVDILFAEYRETNVPHNSNITSAIKDILESIKTFSRKIETSTDIDISTHPHLNSLYICLLSLLWEKAHTFSQDQILSQYKFTQNTFSIPKEIFKQVRKAIKRKIDTFDSAAAEEAVKELVLLQKKTMPEIEKTSIESFASLETEMDIKKTHFISLAASKLKKALSKTEIEERFLMEILHTRVALMHEQVDTSQEYTKVVLQALDNRNLSPLQRYYLAGVYKKSNTGNTFTENEKQPTKEEQEAISALSKQLKLLSM